MREISAAILHEDTTTLKQFPRDWPFMRGIHWWPVDSPHKRVSHAGLWYVSEQTIGWSVELPVIWSAMALMLRPCDVNCLACFIKLHRSVNVLNEWLTCRSDCVFWWPGGEKCHIMCLHAVQDHPVYLWDRHYKGWLVSLKLLHSMFHSLPRKLGVIQANHRMRESY